LPHFWLILGGYRGGFQMKKTIAITAVTLSLISSQALADEHRGGDAALGALAGAVVLGPIGAIAGAAVGYTAGPSIAHSWGFRRSGSAARRTRSAQQQTQHQTQASDTRPAIAAPGPAVAAAPQAAAPAPQAAARAPKTTTASSAPPPVQGLE
jgi:hypothetical protein